MESEPAARGNHELATAPKPEDLLLSPTRQRESDEHGRNPAIDWIKAVGILCVVFIHCLPSFLNPDATPLETWLHAMTSFAVPGFLFASGFLYAEQRERPSWATMRRRLRRILIPYLVFSVLTYVIPVSHFVTRTSWIDQHWLGSSLGPTWGSILDSLAFGSAAGPYYYVFVIFWLTLATPLIARIPRSLFPVFVLGSIAIGWGFAGLHWGLSSFFWWFRNPLHWLCFFALGWWACLHHQHLIRWTVKSRMQWLVAIGALWSVIAVYLALRPTGAWEVLARWLSIYLTIALIFFASVGRERTPSSIRWLSDASYSIYLSHIFFVNALLNLRAGTLSTNALARLARFGLDWTGAMAGSVGILVLSRRILGPHRTRTWLG
ncbi:MAG: hypothetical protein CBC48_01990 [bacterium TMED88]|nr:hypothetical protein [Deltaproteobacteria bacterium]OUV36613.1 MAG: hypothetical protein CBC48_01990 [bacterium TMED88]